MGNLLTATSRSTLVWGREDGALAEELLLCCCCGIAIDDDRAVFAGDEAYCETCARREFPMVIYALSEEEPDDANGS